MSTAEIISIILGSISILLVLMFEIILPLIKRKINNRNVMKDILFYLTTLNIKLRELDMKCIDKRIPLLNVVNSIHTQNNQEYKELDLNSRQLVPILVEYGKIFSRSLSNWENENFIYTRSLSAFTRKLNISPSWNSRKILHNFKVEKSFLTSESIGKYSENIESLTKPVVRKSIIISSSSYIQLLWELTMTKSDYKLSKKYKKFPEKYSSKEVQLKMLKIQIDHITKNEKHALSALEFNEMILRNSYDQKNE